MGEVRTSLIQATAWKNSLIELSTPNFAYGVASIFNPKLRKFALENADSLITRKLDVHLESIIEALSTHKLGKAKETTARALGQMIQLTDFNVALAAWNGIYRQARKSNNWTHEQAQKYANDHVIKSQISASRADISALQRSAPGRAISLFQTFTIGDWNFFIREVLGIKNQKVSKAMVVKRLARYMAANYLINTFYEDILGMRSPLPTPYRAFRELIREGYPVAVALLGAAAEIIEMVPLASSMFGHGTTPLGAVAELLSDTTKLVQKAVGKNIPFAPVWYDVAGKWIGAPAAGAISKRVKIIKRGGTPWQTFVGTYPEKPPKPIKIEGLRGLSGLKELD